MLTDLDGNPITSGPQYKERAAPPVTDPTPEPDEALLALQGDSHTGGASSLPVLKQKNAYARFVERRQLQENLLKKSTADEQLVQRVLNRLDALDTYLGDDEAWFSKLEKASLRDVAIMEGVYIDKLQALRGQATQIISIQHQEKLDQVLPLLMQVMQQRGLTVTATETKRTVEVVTE